MSQTYLQSKPRYEILDGLLNGLTQIHQRYEDAMEKIYKHTVEYEQSLNESNELLEEH